MRATPRPLAVLLALGLASACSQVAQVKDGPSTLSPAEAGAVRAKAHEAEAQKSWKVAWNSEIEAGAARERLEEIALGALADDDGDAAGMLKEIRRKWSGLTPPSEARLRALSADAVKTGKWKRAAEIEIAGAADAPEFRRAWDVYRAAPPEPALDVLDQIQRARADLARGER